VIEQWQLARTTPFSVIHGDYRLDNLLFDGATGEATVVDWQTAAIGPPLRDVAYLLGTSLPSEVRREYEKQLLSEYHDALVSEGIAEYGFEQCWDDYRLGQLQGPMITVLGCIYAAAERSGQADAMFLAMAHRSCAAIRELGSLELI
jgi:aminoglycoside/choline kinase family phosphotransferase